MKCEHVWMDDVMAKGTYFGSAIDFQFKRCIWCPATSLSIQEDDGLFVEHHLQEALETIRLITYKRLPPNDKLEEEET